MIQIICENNQIKKEFELGTTLSEIATDLNVVTKFPILGAFVNNKLKELSYNIYKPKTIEFIDITHPDGVRMFMRSLIFVLQKAVNDVFPDKRLIVQHGISKGVYCEIEGINGALTIDKVFAIGERMREIIEADISFERHEILTTEAIELFEKNELKEKALLFKSRSQLYSSVYC